MKIIDILNGETPSLSFEVFPPKTSDKYESVSKAVAEISKLSPSYISVTYGAGGGTSDYTARIAKEVTTYGVTSLAHLSCISSTKEQVSSQLECLKALGIENILALRGDIPKGFNKSELEFRYAYELVDKIKAVGDFCIGGACYPEVHPESESAEKDLEYLKIKVDHGCNFLTTQMFFDNDIFYRFVEKANARGISVPIVPGIMPITAYSQIERMVMISGNELPKNFMGLISKYENDPISLKKVGIEYAINQARNIYESGFNAVHIYSMNKYDVAKEIQENLRDLFK